MSGAEKPPPTVVGVTGIESQPMGVIGGSQPVNWGLLIELPPFQLFASEKSGQSVSNVNDWIRYFVSAQVQLGDEQKLYEVYCNWHKGQGRWPNETPMGELINGN